MLRGAVPLAAWSSSAVGNPETKTGGAWKELQARIAISTHEGVDHKFQGHFLCVGRSKQLRVSYN